MGIADKIDQILDEKSQVEEKKVLSNIEIFMNWLFSNYEFRLNSLSLKPEFRPIGEGNFRELDDQNYNTISLLAEISGFTKTMVEKLNRILISSYVPTVNEIEDFFTLIAPLGNQAGYDGTAIYMPAVRDYFDCLVFSNPNIDKERLWNIFARWVIASANSALGIKHNDVMLILSGSQGLYKTSYLNNLVPKELGKEKYLVTGHIEPALTNQNTANFLCEKFIVNIDDQLEVIFGKEYNSMKAIISIDRVTSRRVYAKFDRTRKRIANFVGSVNGNEFLSDNQNRRYFVIEVSEIKPEYQDVDMCQFWAEAYKLSKQIRPYDVYGREIYQEINAISMHYTQSSIEQSLISRLFSPHPTDSKTEELFMTNGEIMMELQRLVNKQLSQLKIANELKRLQYQRISKYDAEIKYSRYGYTLYTRPDLAATSFKDYGNNYNEEIF